MKIRDENNRLRDENGKLQRDLQRKLEMIKRLSSQVESLERPQKSQREVLVEHLIMLP